MRPGILKRLKAPSMIVAAILACGVLAAGFMRWPLPDETIAPRLQQALNRSTGYVIESIGDASFSALPWPSVQITHLALRKPSSSQERVDASLLKARLNVASWLFGEPKFVGLSLFDPRIHLASNERLDETEALSTGVLNFLKRDMRPELRSLRIERGTIRLDGQPWMTGFRLSAESGARSDLRLAAAGLYRGAPISIEADVGVAGDRRPVNWVVTSDKSSASFAGTLLGARSLDAEGELTVSIADGSSLARRLGLSPSHAQLLNGMSVSGRSKIALPLIQIREAVIERGDERLEGSLELSVGGGKPSLSATLDTESLNATALLKPILGNLIAGDGAWSSEPFLTSWLNAAALDIRLSAARLKAGAFAVDRAAVTVQLGGGRLDLGLSEASVRAGNVKARLSLIAPNPGMIELRAQGQADRIAATQLTEVFGAGRLRGLANAQFMLEASGLSAAQWSQTVKGRGHITVRDGEIAGIDIDQTAASAERGASAAAAQVRTRFSILNLQMRVEKGSASLFESFIATPAARTPVEGWIDLRNRSLDLTTRPARPGGIPFKLEGPWARPALMPEPTGRLNRT